MDGGPGDPLFGELVQQVALQDMPPGDHGMGEPGPMDGGPGGDPMGEPGPMDPGMADMQSHMDDSSPCSR